MISVSGGILYGFSICIYFRRSYIGFNVNRKEEKREKVFSVLVFFLFINSFVN